MLDYLVYTSAKSNPSRLRRQPLRKGQIIEHVNNHFMIDKSLIINSKNIIKGKRDLFLKTQRITTIRISNFDVINNLEGVRSLLFNLIENINKK